MFFDFGLFKLVFFDFRLLQLVLFKLDLLLLRFAFFELNFRELLGLGLELLLLKLRFLVVGLYLLDLAFVELSPSGLNFSCSILAFSGGFSLSALTSRWVLAPAPFLAAWARGQAHLVVHS